MCYSMLKSRGGENINLKFKMKNLSRIVLLYFYVLMLGNFNFSMGDSELNLNPELPLNLNPLDTVNRVGIKGIGAGELFDAFKLNFPTDLKLNISTDIPLSPKFNAS